MTKSKPAAKPKQTTKATADNKSRQLNPQHETFVKTRGDKISSSDVALVQQAEVSQKGKQEKNGLGAQAQKLHDAQTKGSKPSRMTPNKAAQSQRQHDKNKAKNNQPSHKGQNKKASSLRQK